jgi:hypothetical protein
MAVDLVEGVSWSKDVNLCLQAPIICGSEALSVRLLWTKQGGLDEYKGSRVDRNSGYHPDILCRDMLCFHFTAVLEFSGNEEQEVAAGYRLDWYV